MDESSLGDSDCNTVNLQGITNDGLIFSGGMEPQHTSQATAATKQNFTDVFPP